MGQIKSPSIPKERRLDSLSEVVLGFGKKQNVDESRRCPQCAQPTCLSGCPLGIDILGFIRHLREDDASSALERILKENPFPAVCGRICPAPCEAACIFHDEGNPISIRALERYASDFGKPKVNKEKSSIVRDGKKVAIIGSGPAGMSAAYFLAQAGLGVTIYEAMHEPGGMLRYGIPEFRMPQKILDEQFGMLYRLGVEVKIDAPVGAAIGIREILGGAHSAVVLTTGAGLPNFIDLPGNNLGGVYYAQEFLQRMQGLSKTSLQGQGLFYGTKTVVIGKGNEALDAARLCRRYDQNVHVLVETIPEQLGAHPDDVAAAVEEGINIIAPVMPQAIEADAQGYAEQVTFYKRKIEENNSQLSVGDASGELERVNAQTVIIAAGRQPSGIISRHLPQLRLNDDHTVWTDEQTGLTNIERMFAAGNCQTGAAAVVDAIKSGKDIAKKVLEFLSNEH